MRIFVSEFISSGAMSGTPLPSSLLREGRAMLSALIADLLAVPGCQLTTTLDRRLLDTLDHRRGVALHVQVIDHAEAERIAFDQRATDADATLVIAPETDGVLARRVQRVLDLGSMSLNCLPAAIEVCGDKLRLADLLSARGIVTIPTRLAPVDEREAWELFGSPCVIKPRDGAGSWLTFAIPFRDSRAWTHATSEFAAAGAADRAIIQPWIAGRALSVGCLCDDSGQVELFPIADQHLDGNRFQYQGGRIPADIPAQSVAAIEQLVRTTCGTIAGLRGYIGIDLLLPDSDPQSPMIIEINPRLTTSYVGYRQLCLDNIAARLLQGAGRSRTELIRWKLGTVSFQADGRKVIAPAEPSRRPPTP